MLPPSPTLLDCLTKAGRDVVSVGKIGDIFAHSGTGREVKVAGNERCLMHLAEGNATICSDGGFLMTNFVDFDTQFRPSARSHGYGKALEDLMRCCPQS